MKQSKTALIQKKAHAIRQKYLMGISVYNFFHNHKKSMNYETSTRYPLHFISKKLLFRVLSRFLKKITISKKLLPIFIKVSEMQMNVAFYAKHGTL